MMSTQPETWLGAHFPPNYYTGRVTIEPYMSSMVLNPYHCHNYFHMKIDILHDKDGLRKYACIIHTMGEKSVVIVLIDAVRSVA